MGVPASLKFHLVPFLVMRHFYNERPATPSIRQLNTYRLNLAKPGWVALLFVIWKPSSIQAPKGYLRPWCLQLRYTYVGLYIVATLLKRTPRFEWYMAIEREGGGDYHVGANFSFIRHKNLTPPWVCCLSSQMTLRGLLWGLKKLFLVSNRF